jgi:cytochrome b561
MNKFKLLKVLNPVLFIVFVIQALTALDMVFDLNFVNTQLVFNIHKYNGLLLIVLIAFHIFLNWAWVKANIFKKQNPAA